MQGEAGDESMPNPKTMFLEDQSESIIVKNNSPDVGSARGSIPIAAASTAAPIATRGLITSISDFRRGWSLRRRSW